MRWVVGDIHGMLKPLTTLVGEVRRVDPAARFLFVGDYVNRGPDARGVIDFIMALEGASFVRGNHDDVFDLVVNGECYADNAARGDRVAAFQWFIKYGLDATLMSYGCDAALLEGLAAHCSVKRLDKLAECVPARHRQFIRNLPAAYEEEDLFVVHGKWDADEPTERPGIAERLKRSPALRHRLLWGRFTDEELPRVKAWQRTGYFGHTPVSYYFGLARARRPGIELQMVPVAGNKMVLVDTAAALGIDGRLSALCADNGTLIQADHFGNLVVPATSSARATEAAP